MTESLLKMDIAEGYNISPFANRRCRKRLSDIHLSIYKGETIMVAGPSGIGKSTLLCLIRSKGNGKGISSICSGVRFEGKIVKADDLKIRFSSQALTINTAEKVCDALTFDVKRNSLWRLKNTKYVERKVDYWLGRFGLSDRKDMYISALSGGECRRVQIAERCAVNEKAFNLLICDEPDTGLSITDQATLHEMLCKVAKENDKAVMTVSHNVNNMYLYDKILLLGRGRSMNETTIRYFGSPSKVMSVFHEDTLLSVFLQLEKPIVHSKADDEKTL